MRVVNDFFYGCGICDMKGFIVVVLVKVLNFVGLNLKWFLYFVFIYDEEVGCFGV